MQDSLQFANRYPDPAASALHERIAKSHPPAMLAQADSGAGLVYICNPNNPTASLTPRNDLEAFIRKLPPTTTVLIDEAYHHFVDKNIGLRLLH